MNEKVIKIVNNKKIVEEIKDKVNNEYLSFLALRKRFVLTVKECNDLLAELDLKIKRRKIDIKIDSRTFVQKRLSDKTEKDSEYIKLQRPLFREFARLSLKSPDNNRYKKEIAKEANAILRERSHDLIESVYKINCYLKDKTVEEYEKYLLERQKNLDKHSN